MANHCWTGRSLRRSIGYLPAKFGAHEQRCSCLPAFICTLLSISLLLYLYLCARLLLSSTAVDDDDDDGTANNLEDHAPPGFNVNRSDGAPSSLISSSSLQLEAVTAQSYNLHASNYQKVFSCGSRTPRRPLRSEIRWNNYDWQNPENTGLFVYSAFYDRRMRVAFPRDGHSFVRILAMIDDSVPFQAAAAAARRNHRDRHENEHRNPASDAVEADVQDDYYCHIWLDDDDESASSSATCDEPSSSEPIVVRAEMREIWHPEWDDDPSSRRHSSYKPFLLSCIVPRKYDRFKWSGGSSSNCSTLQYVSVSTEPCKASGTYVAVQLAPPSEVHSKKQQKEFVVCVKPIDFAGDFSRKLIEWIELNAALGVDNIHIYRFRAHPNVDRVLAHYAGAASSGNNLVTVTETTLAGNQPNYPLERSAFLKRNLWQKRRNELLPYNDCFYRHLYSHRYVIPIDLDEVIVPRRHRDLRHLFAYLETSAQYSTMLNMYASFSVRNAYFFESSKLDHDDQRGEQHESSYFMRHTVRSANFSVGGKATKSVVRTDAALTVFNHYVLDSLLPGVGRSHEIPVQLVQMNHYRASCPADMSHECNNNFLKYTRRDTILWKYKSRLLDAIKLVTRILNL